MIKEISLFDEINKGGFQASLITTFNAYFPFYEEVILRKLVSKSINHNLILMDKNQFCRSIKSTPPRLAGTYYSLFPMYSPGAFHPKILLLAGKKKGVLFIGSHNLTISGFGYNRELTNVIRYSEKEHDQDALNIIKSTWLQINGWFMNQSFPVDIVNMVKRVEGFAPWLKGEASDDGNDLFVLSSQPDKQSLFSQLSEKINGVVRRIIVTGAFFDSELEFVRTLQEKFSPDKIIVAVDPKTVSFPSDKRENKDVRFVNSSLLGTKKEGEENSYLHAKSMLIEQNNGKVFLITGSANPSRPAWLKEGLKGNTEIVLCRSDDLVKEDAEKLDFFKIFDMPLLDANDWETIKGNRTDTNADEENKSTEKVGLAVASYNSISFSVDAEESIESLQCELLDSSKISFKKVVAVGSGDKFTIKIGNQISKKVSWVQCDYNAITFLFLVHHESEISERSKTGTQRRLKDALSSISTDSPDIGVVIDCVSKIIFSTNDSDGNSKKINTENTQTDKKKDNVDDGSPLSISLKNDPKYKRKKLCLDKSDDLSWLFDTLLYHLNIDLETSVEGQEELDYEPNEEELIGSDDDCTEDREKRKLKILDKCHNKIRLLVRRMLKQFEALRQDETNLEGVILKLTGTLSLLRHLRGCDGKLSWIAKGHTSFPKEFRLELLDGITDIFFDGKFSLVYENEVNLEVYDSDELARLKGLIVWLAWDAGIELDTAPGFNESFKEREDRLRKNGVMLQLAQLIDGDEIVKSELSKSMMLVEKKVPDWLKWINDADKKLRKVLDSIDAIDKLGKYNKPLPVGALAIDKKNPTFGVRIIGKRDRSGVDVFNFLPEKKYQRLSSDNSIFLNFNAVMKKVGL